MSYYTQRHGLRKAINKTSIIDIPMYELLFNCCEKYKINIAWKYPDECQDGCGDCGLNEHNFNTDMLYEIPSLFRYDNNEIGVPTVHVSLYSSKKEYDEYDQYALLDYIEFFAQNCRDVIQKDFHRYYGHYHYSYKDTDTVFIDFQKEINDIFTKTGLLYVLTDKKIVERVVENSPLSPEIESSINTVKEKGTRELLKEAILLYKGPYPESSRDAVEKIWDALERLKTYYTQLDKKNSISKVINDMSGRNSDYIDLFDTEFKALTSIGNTFRIRHHETNKIDITDVRHYDYFFNRCLSIIALAIQYLQ